VADLDGTLPMREAGALRHLLHPRSVAVVGASGRPHTLGALTLENLVRFGFTGAVYPVNPGYEELAGRRCFPSLCDVPGPVDLVLVLTPAASTPAVIAQCIDVGAAGAVIFSSGFAELGEQGRRQQDQLARAARHADLRLLGPNCQGLLHQSSGLVATFSAAVRAGLHKSSGIAYIGQSGAVGGSFLDLSRERGVGLASWVTTGNESDISVSEVALELIAEPEIHTLAIYLEAIQDGRDWQRLLARAEKVDKQIVVLRSGRSAAGRAAATSHTGAMIGSDTAFALMCERYGAQEVEDVSALLDAVVALAPRRRMSGPGVAVVTSSGGAGGLAADQLDAAGLLIAPLAADTRQALGQLIPAYGSTDNPIDVTAQLFTKDSAAFGAVLDCALADEAVDGVLVTLTQVVDDRAADVARAIVSTTCKTTKPVGVVWLAAVDQTHEARRILRAAGVPLFDDISHAARALARVHRSYPGRSRARRQPEAGRVEGVEGCRLAPVLQVAARAGAWVLTEWQGAAVLDAVGVARPDGRLVMNARDAHSAAQSLGGPVVLKVQSPDIAHKTDVGAVRVGVAAADVESTFEEIIATVGDARPDARIEGVLVQPMAPPGVELVVGVDGPHDGYPPVVTVGLGGITTELYADIVSALAPVSAAEALVMLRELRGWPMLDGYRGRPPLDVDAAAGAVAALSRAAASLGPALVELEVNPLIIHEHGSTAVDLILRHRAVAEPACAAGAVQ